MKIIRNSQLKAMQFKKYILKAQHEQGYIKTYTAETKTDCMYKFDRLNLRRGFKFFIVEVKGKVFEVKAVSRDYPYQVNILE